MRKYSLSTVIKKLIILQEHWPENLSLFGDNGTLRLMDIEKNNLVVEDFSIPCDGGDPDRFYDENGNEHLNVSP